MVRSHAAAAQTAISGNGLPAAPEATEASTAAPAACGHADPSLRADARGRDGGIREELAARMKKKKERRVYLPRVLGSGQAMIRPT
jgi:hypothetical protein